MIKLLIITLITACALWVGIRGAWRGSELQRRLICAANVKGIGASAKVYASSWDGTSPIIDWLVKTGTIDANATKCPCADFPNYIVVNETLGALNAHRPMDNRMIVAYEPKSNHGGEGGNVLYVDGHVEFVPVPKYNELLNSVPKIDP